MLALGRMQQLQLIAPCTADAAVNEQLGDKLEVGPTLHGRLHGGKPRGPLECCVSSGS